MDRETLTPDEQRQHIWNSLLIAQRTSTSDLENGERSRRWVPIEEVREKGREGKGRSGGNGREVKRREWREWNRRDWGGGLDGGKRRSECYRSERETEKGRC